MDRCEALRARAGCCITDRANGIRANRCRAGRWLLLARRRRAALARSRTAGADDDGEDHFGRDGCAALHRNAGAAAGRRSGLHRTRRSKIRSTICSASGDCRSTSIRWTTIWKTRGARAPAQGFRARARTTRLAMCCRCSAPGQNGPEWQTGLWMLRGQHLFLVPGDSPLGLRLPLASLPWVAAEDAPKVARSRSLGESRTACRCRAAASRRIDPVPQRPSRHEPRPQAGDRANPRPGWCARRCAWSRAKDACTFSCRRWTAVEDYLDLLAAIEDTAAHLEMPVVIEGYPPPYDPRVQQLQGHARPRGDRSEHSSCRQLAGAGGQHHLAL